MFVYLVIIFTVLPALELGILIHVGSYIGVANTILLIILTGVMGAYLARLQGYFVVHSIQTSLSEGRMPTEEMLDGLMIFVGGIVLLTPGFITDALGFLLLIPWTRMLIKMLIRKKFEESVREGTTQAYHTRVSRQSRHDFEDADFHE